MGKLEIKMKIHETGIPDIIQFGPYRSGSTFMFQYLKQLFPDKKILKLHGYDKTDVPVVITVRDFRDCVASYWRIEYPLKIGGGKKIEIGKTFMTEEDIDFYSKPYFMQDKILHQYLVSHKVVVLQYEKFFDNFEYLHDRISNFFDIHIDGSRRANLELSCSLKHNKKFQEKYDNFESYDLDNGIHGDHIFTGMSIWNEVVPDNLKKYYNDKLQTLLNNWNYDE
jgi:hypothetical protein